MGGFKGVGLHFQESMSGYLDKSQTDPTKAEEAEPKQREAIRFDVRIAIDDLNRFMKVSGRRATLTGTVTSRLFGGACRIRDGTFRLFSIDPATGIRQMVYAFRFAGSDGRHYYLHGHKELHHHRGKPDVVEDMTRLFTVVYEGDDDRAPVLGAGILRFALEDVPSLVASIEVSNAKSFRQRMAAYVAFTSFIFAPLREEYLKNVRIGYQTEYENLVLSGVVNGRDGVREFFLVSGVHEKGFPWGDDASFWDVILAVDDGTGGTLRYGITDHALDGLHLDVQNGTYRYQGPVFRLDSGFAASSSQMRAGGPPFVKCRADIEIDFDARAEDPVSYPPPVLARSVAPLVARLREALPVEHPLGMSITPHTVVVRAGRLGIERPAGEDAVATASETWQIDADKTFGEAERSTFRSLKEPTLLYGYICGLRPQERAARVQIHTRTLRDERELWAKDQLDKCLGKLLSRIASAEMLIEGGSLRVRRLAGGEGRDDGDRLFVKLGDPIVELNNDHFPTAVFQRRIIKVRDPDGQECLALEEDMSRMRLDAIGSDREVTVAAIRNERKFDALDRVLAETGFAERLEVRRAQTGKAKGEFGIVIKPNFMFAYDKADRSTYTDPELVARLVERIRQAGYTKIAVAEAQSTYGQYFDRRSVREMAEYLGYDGQPGYTVVDMTEDAREHQHLGPHLGDHPVSTVWRDADFRISFAKNKTHSYAYYTLTLKNIYGALPLANKFQEYHCRRDIYHTAIEYLAAFPVHFGLVDAYESADGPFGIFADPLPNPTHTVIGGADLVAVDWVAATKMGIDPMLSPYMPLAVRAFGKPQIRLVGDASMYQPWLNVPVGLTLLAHKGVDANYQFGNLMYTCCAQMDEKHFTHKSRAPHIRLLRRLTVPLRRTFFKRSHERPTWCNRLVSRLVYKLGH